MTLLDVCSGKAHDPRVLGKMLLGAARNGNLKEVKLALSYGADPKFSLQGKDFEALSLAAQNGHLDVVKCLLPISGVKVRASMALTLAAQAGHVKVVKELLPHSELVDLAQMGLMWAAKAGHVECLKLILSAYDALSPDDKGVLVIEDLKFNAFTSGAASGGQLECLKLLSEGMSSDDVMGALNSAIMSQDSNLSCVEFLRGLLPERVDLTVPISNAALCHRKEYVSFFLPNSDADELIDGFAKLDTDAGVAFVRSFIQKEKLRLRHLSKESGVCEGRPQRGGL